MCAKLSIERDRRGTGAVRIHREEHVSEAEQANVVGEAARNPYATPHTNIAKEDRAGPIEGGRKVSAGRGATWIAQGYSLFKRSPGVWIGIAAISIIGSIVLSVIPLGGLALNLLTPVLMAGMMLGCRALERGEPLEVAHLFAGFKQNVGQLVLVGLLYMLGMLVILIGSAVVGGLGAFAVLAGGGQEAGAEMYALIAIAALAGVGLSLPLVMAIWFAPALVIFDGLDAVPAMKKSFFGCLINLVPFLVYGALAFLLALPASLPMTLVGAMLVTLSFETWPLTFKAALVALPLTLGWLVLWPMVIASLYKSYQDIFAPAPDSEQQPAS
jgi:hypothetical protein